MTPSSTLDILAFGAHPDDVEIGCGGTLIRAVDDGRQVGIVDLTRGEMGTRGTVETRAEERLAAAELLGISVREQLDFGDGNLAAGRDQELALIELIRRYRPNVLIAPWPDDRHPDHTRTGRLVTDAWFYAGLVRIETELPPHRPDAVLYYIQNYVQHPSLVVDVTAVWDRRVEAMRAYQSQFHNPDSDEPMTFIAKPSFLKLIEARARHFGALAGVEFGEAFVSKQPPQIDDLVQAYRGREVS